MKIGHVAKLAGVNIETIRYYQRRGLLGLPERRPGLHRHYSHETVERILFIKNAQSLGFTLAEISVLLGMPAASGCHEIRAMVKNKIIEVRRQIDGLKQILHGLEQIMGRACKQSACSTCPLRQQTCQLSSKP